ncbi:MAG: formylglycine-generating enzyme family protein [Bacteroidales bacterium]|nr:formylglycine-generating enzyme family protein [Bacteroidales bacterium]
MKRTFYITLFLLVCSQASGQDYLQIAGDCFEKGDYECARRNYTLYQTFEGKDMSVQIKQMNELLQTLSSANALFEKKGYEKAQALYKTVMDANPKDPYAKKQYDECVQQIRMSRLVNYTEKSSRLGIEMVAVEGGMSLMGCTKEQESECSEREKPVHLVILNDFFIGKYPITQRQWRLLMGTTLKKQRDKESPSAPIFGEGDNYPMYYVSWEEAQEFIRRLNVRSRKEYRLATEAEWEYAARGGNKSQGFKYSGSNHLSEVGWYQGNSKNISHPVGTKSSNELGIYDMNGNIWEWCSDWYDDYTRSMKTDPTGPPSGTLRVSRGGSWGNDANRCRTSSRAGNFPARRYYVLGFRIAHSL